MAQYIYDMSEQPLGSLDGWSTESGSEIDPTFEIADVNSERVLKVTATMSGGLRGAIHYPDEVSADADRANQEILVCYRTVGITDENQHPVRLRWINTNNHYFADWRSDNGLRWRVRDGGSTTTLFQDSDNTITQDDWWWLRARFNGTLWSVRAWADGDSEPGTWDATGTDSSHSNGEVGVGIDFEGVELHFSWVGIGTDGDTIFEEAEESDNPIQDQVDFALVDYVPPAHDAVDFALGVEPTDRDPTNLQVTVDGTTAHLSWDTSPMLT